jgi:hypothetical protein
VSLNIFIPEHLLEAVSLLDADSALAKLMAKATHERLAMPMDALICVYAGIETASGELPIAAISYLGEATTEFSADAANTHLLIAEPVHLILQRDSFSLSSPVPIALSLDESTSLLASLNAHFNADGLQFVLTPSGRWYVHTDQQVNISTSNPALAIDRDINAFLPQGIEAGRWRQLLNEIQMLLFSHPVNHARELAGLPLCNSVWFWGGGQLPSQRQHAVAKVHASTSLLKGLGRLGYVDIVDSTVAMSISPLDKPLWLILNESEDLNEEAFISFTAMLKSGQVRTLQLHYAVGGQVLRSRLARPGLWKFWCKSSPMRSYFEA